MRRLTKWGIPDNVSIYPIRFWIALFITGLSCSPMMSPAAQEQDLSQLHAAVSAVYEARGEQLSSLYFEWHGTDTWGGRPDVDSTAIEDGLLVPLAVSGAVTIADEGLLFERFADLPNESTGEVTPAYEIHFGYENAIDEERHFFPQRERGAIGSGSVAARSFDIQEMTLPLTGRPPFLIDQNARLLGFGEEAEADFLIYAIEPPESIIIDPVTGTYERNGPNGVTMQSAYERHEFVLDPARDYVVVSHRTLNYWGARTMETTLEYSLDEELGYIPSGLEYIHFGGGEPGIRLYAERTVSRVDFNFPVDPSLFRIEFPEGTVVNDLIRGDKYTVGGPDDPANSGIAAQQDHAVSQAKNDQHVEASSESQPRRLSGNGAASGAPVPLPVERYESEERSWDFPWAALPVAFALAGVAYWFARRSRYMNARSQRTAQGSNP